MRPSPASFLLRRQLVGLFASCVAVTTALSASASAALASTLPAGFEITPISAERTVWAFGVSECYCGPDGEFEGYSDSDTASTMALGVWERGVYAVGTEASQLTRIAPDELGGRIEIRSGGTAYDEAEAAFGVTFSVPAARAYQIEAIFDGNAFDYLVALSSDLGTVFELTGYEENPGAFLLEPGRTYDLEASVRGTSATGGITFSMVPEPSTALLVGLGLAGLSARRRRARSPALWPSSGVG